MLTVTLTLTLTLPQLCPGRACKAYLIQSYALLENNRKDFQTDTAVAHILNLFQARKYLIIVAAFQRPADLHLIARHPSCPPLPSDKYTSPPAACGQIQTDFELLSTIHSVHTH
jgi:hypothetical protein